MKASATLRKDESPTDRRTQPRPAAAPPQLVSATAASSRSRRRWLPLTPVSVLSGGAGVASAAIGALVVAGWLTGRMGLTQWSPEITPVSYNTGVCLVLLGLALLALNLKRGRWAIALAPPVLPIAALTLAAFAGSSHTVDQLFSLAHLGTAKDMAPNAAIAFIFLAMSILGAAWTSQRFGSGHTAMLAAAGGSLGMVGLCGYAARLPAAYMWWQMTPMKPQGALGLMVLGAGVTAWAWGNDRARMGKVPSWLPLLSLLAGATLAVALWEALRTSQAGQLLPSLVLLSGVASATLLAVSLRLGRQARLRAEAIDRLNRELSNEVERVQAAQAEASAASLYARTLIEASLDPLVTISKAGTIMDVNRATEAVTGVAREQLIGSDFSSYFTDPELARRGYEQVFETGFVQDYALAIRRADGRVAEVLYNATVFRNQRGEVEGVFAAARDITERKRADEALRRQAALLDLAHDAILVRDMDSRITFWTHGAEETYGWPAAQAIGKISHALLQTRFPTELVSIQATVQSSGQWEGELEHTTRDGRRIVVASRWSLLRDELGVPAAMLEINRDITERQNAAEAVRLSEERYRGLTEAASQIVWTTTPNGEVAGDMPLWRQYTGLKEEELQGWGWLQSVHPDDRERTAAVWASALQSRSLYETEYRIQRHDGEYRHFWVRGVPILDGGEVREWVGTCTDITERKRAEIELQRLNQSLRTLSDCNAAVLHAGEEPALLRQLCELIVRDGNYRLAWVGIPEQNNGKIVRPRAHAGPGAGYLQGIDISWDESVPTGRGPTGTCIRSGAVQVCRELSADGAMEPWQERVAGSGFRSSASLPLLDGKKVLGSLTIYSADVDAFSPEAVQLFSELASNVGFGIASLRLREERERMRAALQDRTMELESAVKELEAFAYSVSHDLRAPLRSIDGFSQILLEDYTEQLDESGKDCLRRVRAGCQNMGQLIDAVLQLSRITRTEMHPEMVDLSLLALGEAAMLQRLNPGRQVEIRIASGLQARGDRKLLQVALQNLMENAWKFTSKQPAARIEVGATQRDGRQVFFVRDNGAGFDMTYASKLFQPFQRLHSKDEYEGTGIGLASVQRIVQRLGGKIRAEGTPGHGATFYFYFT